MTTLVLTVVGNDRHGLVAAVAEVVAARGGNWESSQLAELRGAFAGIIEVTAPPSRVEGLRAALIGLDGLLTVGIVVAAEGAAPARLWEFRVLGNDRPGIVRDVSSVLSAHGVSIEKMTTETRDAAMAGGRLFEATVSARVAASTDLDDVIAALERLAAEIQVDVTLSA